jgi:proline dehydrogenase
MIAQRYVAGLHADIAAATAERLLKGCGLRSSLFYLGEYVDDSSLVELNMANKLAAIQALRHKGLDIHVSVDPTQIGSRIAPGLAEENALQLASAVAAAAAAARDGFHALMLDMEDSTLTDFTLRMYRDLASRGLPVAITLQAYLRRTHDDLTSIINSGQGRVRLVKGAFAEGQAIAYTTAREIKANQHRLVLKMLSGEARERGFYPIIATHDTEIHRVAIDAARRQGWRRGSYEFEMLLGVRSEVARDLASSGERVRLYLPFGEDWWPYGLRRIGENPRNATLLLRSLFSRA